MTRRSLARKIYCEEPMGLSVPRTRRRRRNWVHLAFLGAGSLCAVTLLLLLYLGLCTEIVEEQYALDHYEAVLPALREENLDLQVEVRGLSELSRIDRIARSQLHMEIPGSRLMIEEDSNVTADRGNYYAWKGIVERIGSP